MADHESLKIFHLTQRHKVEGGSAKGKELATHSQYNIAKYISIHNKIPVVVEGINEDSKNICATRKDDCDFARNIVFPNGLPQKYEELNFLQKSTIYEMGGPVTLLYLGIIPALYGAIDEHNGNIANEKLERLSTREFLATFRRDPNWDNREALAIEFCKKAAKKHYGDTHNKEVILVFGGDHDFTSECNKQGFKLGVISFDEPEHRLSDAYISKVNGLLSTFIYDTIE